uniref:Cytochrome P450 n=1 Tax=Panagrolaimus sp. ES5 TaxID=591445 RepID=A0AC34G5N9_9BILA
MFSFLIAFVYFFFRLLTWTLILALPLGIAYFFYLKHRSTYFQRIGLPHPPVTSLFLGNLGDYENNLKQHEKILEWSKKYGTTFGMIDGGAPTIVTSDPEIINEVFVKQYYTFQARKFHPSFALDQENNPAVNVFFAQGNQWKRLRALFAGSLATGKIKAADPIIKRAAQELIQVFEKHENDVIDVSPQILNFTFAVIARSALGIDEEFGKSTYLNRKAIDFRSQESAEEKSERHQDFLDFMHEAEDPNFDATNNTDLYLKVPKKLTREELIQSARGFLIAGADTTATLLNYCLYELARHPECEEIIVQEIEDFIKSEDDIIYNNVKDLTYLDRFVKEVARFHPLAFTVTARRAIHSTTLKTSDGKQLQIDKGVGILANAFAIQMDENIWGSDAKEFNPDRFLPENSVHRHPMAWLPFGAGPRICPGKNLALHEAKS